VLSLSPGNSFVFSWCDHKYASFFALRVSNSSLFTPALLRTHSFVFFDTHRIFLSPFISKASRRVSSFFLSAQLLQPYVATGYTSAFISRVFLEIGVLWLFHKTNSIKLLSVACHYFLLGLQSPSQAKNVTILRPYQVMLLCDISNCKVIASRLDYCNSVFYQHSSGSGSQQSDVVRICKGSNVDLTDVTTHFSVTQSK